MAVDSRLGQTTPREPGVSVAGEPEVVRVLSERRFRSAPGRSRTPPSAPRTPTSRPDQGLPASVNRKPSALSKPRPQVIIISEPSAEPARRVRTGRSLSARSGSSAALNDTPRHADARPTSVHTEERPAGSA
jgi:hypothetical protein